MAYGLYPSIQIVMLRSLFGLIPLMAIVYFWGGIAACERRNQAFSCCVPVLALVRWSVFHALSVLGLAETVTLAHFFTALCHAAFDAGVGERVGLRRLSATIAGFIGVVIVVRPGTEIFKFDALILIAASFCFAMTMVLARRLSSTDTSVSMTFYTTLAGLAVGVAGTFWAAGISSGWTTPLPADWLLFPAWIAWRGWPISCNVIFPIWEANCRCAL